MEETDSIHLTFDIDWAPDFIIEALVDMLTPLGLPITVFCTHDSPAVRRLLDLQGCESGLHPNLMDAQDEEAHLGELHDVFPNSTGLRVHRLYYHSGLLGILLRRGFTYLSNDLMFMEPGLRPFRDWAGLVRLPIYWEDDVHATVYNGSYDIAALELERPGLKVFNFHPVHLYLNTERFQRYTACKQTLHDQEKTMGFRNHGRGCRTLFQDLVERHHSRVSTNLAQVADAFSRSVSPHAGFKPLTTNTDE